MKDKRLRYGVIGTGAVGGYYGGRLANAGHDVHFLLHSDYDWVVDHGIQVDSCNGSFHLDNVNAYADSSSMPPCDVVIVALKTTNNHLLPGLAGPLLKEDTLVLLIQNGIGVEDDVQQMLPGVQIAAGLAFICCAKTGKGHISHQSLGSINIGNYSCRNESLTAQVCDDFNQSGIKSHEMEYHEARWRKAIWNMPFNGMSVALNTQTNLLLDNPSTLSLIRAQMLEVIGAARHLGVKDIDQDIADKMIENTRHMVPYSTSMLLDHVNGRSMEIEYIYTRPIAIAKAAGYAMPRLEMLENELRFIEWRGQNKSK